MIKTIKVNILNLYSNFTSLWSNKQLIKQFLLSFFIYLIGYLSLLKADYLYWDDVKRVHGIQNYATASRPLNELLCRFIFWDEHTHDISPLTQILAIFFLSIASLLLIKLICQELTYKRIILVSILGFSPYFLQNMSYKFDSPFMALSLVWAIYPFLFFQNKKYFYFHSVLGLALMLMTYQASISIWLMLLLYLSFRELLQSRYPLKEIFCQFFISMTMCILTSFVVFLIVNYFNRNGWVKGHSQLCSLSDCPKIAFNNFSILLNYITHHWTGTHLGFLFISTLIFFLSHLTTCSFLSKNKLAKMDKIIISLLVFSGMLISIIVWTLFFTHLVLEPRILIGFGGLFAIALLNLSMIENLKIRIVALCCAFMLVWNAFIFTSRYGNLLAAQKQYELTSFGKLSLKLDELNIKNIRIDSGKLQSPLVKTKAEQFPLLNNLVFFHLEQESWPYDYLNIIMNTGIRNCSANKQDRENSLYSSNQFSLTQVNDSCVKVHFWK